MNDKHAFPNLGEYGLTKREWFAGQALAGIMANNGLLNGLRGEALDKGRDLCDVVAFAASAQADAMIAESEKGGAA